MARLPRAVAVDTPHHVTQRGNARQFILESDSARLVYLQLLQHACRLHRLSLLGYCLMSNHVHLIAIPQRPDSLAAALKQVHGRYAAYFNALHASSGHVWQGRYYSCALDPPHLWAALRYTELNPVRAGLVAEPEAFPWSCAAAHCLPAAPDPLLDLALWRSGTDGTVHAAQEPRLGTVTSVPFSLLRLGCPMQADAAQQETARIYAAVAAAPQELRKVADRNKRPQGIRNIGVDARPPVQ